jgi:cell division protein ZipA
MDSTELRLILLGLGLVLVIGIYAWEKSKRQRRTARERVKSVSSRRVNRQKKKFAERFFGGKKEKPAPANSRGRQEPILRESPDPEHPDAGTMPPAPEPDPEFSTPHPEPEPTETSPAALAAEPMPQVLALHVVARVGSRFDGDAIMSAARDVGLVPGEMEIFHRTDENTGEVVFSMANMVKPGTFAFHAMSDFHSPGLALFAQLPGPKQALVMYDELLAAADRLAALLDGRVQDDKRSPLTPDKIDEMRQRLLVDH